MPAEAPLRKRAVAIVAVALLAPLAVVTRAEEGADSWEEPTLEDALRRAKLVIRGRALGATGDDHGSPRVVVERTIVGTSPGDAVVVGNATAARSFAGLVPPLEAGEDAIFILEEVPTPAPGAPKLRLPTPSFGRFRVVGGRVIACPRDSFVRVDMSAEAYEDFLKNASAAVRGGHADAAWLDSARAVLKNLDPTARKSLPIAHVALETLCYGAQESDADLALRYFGSSEMQLRISAARLLARAGSGRAGSGLLRLATDDSEPAVRTVATLALAQVKPTPESVVPVLAGRLGETSAAPISLASSKDDPRRAGLASNLGASLFTLRALGAGEQATLAAIDLLARDDENTLAEACLYLTRERPVGHLHEIAHKMRDKDDPFTAANKFIAELLRKITGAPIGPERDRWINYLEQNREIYPAPGDR
jgi:hypothetical protein